jgi:hypothetical protein
MALRHLQTAMQGVQLGLDIRESLERTQLILNDRADRQKAEQVAAEQEQRRKAIEAPLATHKEKIRLYKHEVTVGRLQRDPKLETEMAAELFKLRIDEADAKMNDAMNTIAANSGNQYVTKAQQELVQAQLATFETLKQESMLSDRMAENQRERDFQSTEAQKQREHQEGMQLADQQGDFSAREHAAAIEQRRAGAEDARIRGRMERRAELDAVGGSGKGKGGDRLKALETAELRAEALWKRNFPTPEEEQAEVDRYNQESGADPVDLRTYRESWLDSETDRALVAAGHQDMVNVLRGRGEGAEGAAPAAEEDEGDAIERDLLEGLKAAGVQLDEEEAKPQIKSERERVYGKDDPVSQGIVAAIDKVGGAIAETMRPVFGPSHVDEHEEKQARAKKLKKLMDLVRKEAERQGLSLEE